MSASRELRARSRRVFLREQFEKKLQFALGQAKKNGNLLRRAENWQMFYGDLAV